MYNTYLVLPNDVREYEVCVVAAFLCRRVWILTPTPKLPDRSHWAISALQRRWRLGQLGNQEMTLSGLNAPTWQRIPCSDLRSNLDQIL